MKVFYLLAAAAALTAQPHPAAAPKQSAVTRAAESAEHATARKRLEKAKSQSATLSHIMLAYAPLAIALNPATLCDFATEVAHPWWRDCRFRTKEAAVQANISAETLTAALQELCDDIRYYDSASTCYDRVRARLDAAASLLNEIDLPTLEKRLAAADHCASIYRTTIDKKISDLSIRETDQVAACRALSLFPPET